MSSKRSTRQFLFAVGTSLVLLAMSAAQVFADGAGGPFPK
jgi:hypothetical protein